MVGPHQISSTSHLEQPTIRNSYITWNKANICDGIEPTLNFEATAIAIAKASAKEGPFPSTISRRSHLCNQKRIH